MAPVEVRSENFLVKLLAFLSFLNSKIPVRYVCKHIGQLFKWNNGDPVKAKFDHFALYNQSTSESEICAKINLPCMKVKELKNCCTRRVNSTFPNEDRQRNKKAVENSIFEQSADTIQKKKHSSSVSQDALNQGPELLQCAGGNGNNSPTKNETTVEENKQSNQTIGHVGHGHGNNNGGCEGDGNDPPNKNSDGLWKGHYRESAAEPVENKDDVLKRASKLRLPLPESSGKDDNGSTKMQMETSPSFNTRPTILSGEADDHFGNVSSMMNASESSELYGFQSSVLDGQELNVMGRDESRVTDELESDATDGHESSGTDGHLLNMTNEEESNVTERNSVRIYEILYPFQSALSVFYDGLYRLERDFIILREICRGMFGVCFEILDIRSGKKYAMKQILLEKFNGNELKIWSRLTSNRNVVLLLGAYHNGKHVHIFMELMDGTLKYIADNREALCITDRKVAAVIKPILEVLVSMHEQGYVHFDIKPDNILIDHGDIKLIDFGLSVNRTETTGNIGPRGTVPYMAKELFCGGECGASTDIYATACTMLHLLSGSPPWPGFVRDAIMYKVGCCETPEVPSNCSEQMKSALKCMLQPDHEERPTAREILLYPLFSDSPESVLDDVLQEVLVDVQLLRSQPNDDLSFSPMTLDGEDEEYKDYEGADPALPL